MTNKKRKDRRKVRELVRSESEGVDAGLAGRGARSGYAGPDLDKYRCHVEHFDLTGAQKTDLLLAVWRIMQSFVDRAFGLDPVQQVRPGRSALEGPDHPVIDLQPVDESGDDEGEDRLSGAFARRAAGRDER